LGVAGFEPRLRAHEAQRTPSPDEMFKTITPVRRGNTLDPEVRNPALQGRGEVIEFG